MPKLLSGTCRDPYDVEITDAQLAEYVALCARLKQIPRIVHCGGSDPYLGCQFDTIIIGIEPDGYAHS